MHNTMTTQDALRILIETSYLLTDEQKTRLLAEVDTFSKEQLEELAYVLAVEKKNSIKRYENGEQTPEKITEQLEKLLRAREEIAKEKDSPKDPS